MVEITNKDKAECAEREVKQRRYVYPRRVGDGKMTQALADRQIAIMEAIASDYRALAETEDRAGRLF
jgi:hypothetical protein